MVDTGRARGFRTRIWLGALAVAAGSSACGLAAERRHAAASWAAAEWPWLALALALVNVLRSAAVAGSVIAPGLIAAVALLGLATSQTDSRGDLIGVMLPGPLVLLGIALLGSARAPDARSAWTRVLVTGRAKGPPAIGDHTRIPRLTIRAVVGEVRADLTGSVLDGEVAIYVTTIAGHVHLTVPRTWPVVVCSAGTVLTRVTDTGPRDVGTDGAADVGLHLLGLSGAVSLVRT